MEAEHGLAGRLLAYGVLDNRIPPLWETRPQDFPLAGEILRLAQGLVVHSRYVEDGARAAGYEGPIARIPHPAWARGRRNDDRRKAHRLLRAREREQAHSAAVRGVRAAPRAAPRSAAAPRRRRLAPARRSRAARGRDARRLRRRGRGSGRSWSLATSSSRCGHRPWARRRARSSARCRSASRSSSRTSAGSPSCRTAWP